MLKKLLIGRIKNQCLEMVDTKTWQMK